MRECNAIRDVREISLVHNKIYYNLKFIVKSYCVNDYEYTDPSIDTRMGPDKNYKTIQNKTPRRCITDVIPCC